MLSFLFHQGLALDVNEWPQHDATHWPLLRSAISSAFASRTLSHWAAVFDASGPLADACVTPVLTPGEGQSVLQRGTGIRAALEVCSAEAVLTEAPPVPLFSTTAGQTVPLPLSDTDTSGACIVHPGENTEEVLTELGYSADSIIAMLARGVAMQTGRDCTSGDGKSQSQSEAKRWLNGSACKSESPKL